MKILCIKDHVCSSINDFRVRIREITNLQLRGRCIRRKKMKMNNRQFYNWQRITGSCIFYVR